MGTSASCYTNPAQTWDHPHAYGDKSGSFAPASFNIGSSPRVWGQAGIDYLERVTTRIIPTRMGTSISSYSLDKYCKDHPHAYGDKFFHAIIVYRVIGSSPRVWGQGVFSQNYRKCYRITPTRMGTSKR